MASKAAANYDMGTMNVDMLAGVVAESLLLGKADRHSFPRHQRGASIPDTVRALDNAKRALSCVMTLM